MLHHWHSAVDRGKSVRIVFVDFAKGFDHVDHNILDEIGDVLSEWVEITAGSYLSPLAFIILIYRLKPACLTQKYVDDTTLTEILHKSTASSM